MKLPLRILLFILFDFLAISCYSQKEYNNWYFGDSAGISFSSGIPVALMNSAMYQGEGCAAISDSSGDLLFYTNGMSVFNRLHQKMPNGNGLMGAGSTTQSALIVGKPLCEQYYYVFTAAPQSAPDGLRFSIVDMQADGGFGDVVEKNTLLLSPATEKITAVRHANGVDVWIIAHGWNNNWFYSWLLTPNGLNLNAVISPVGNIYGSGDANVNAIGYLKPSPKGNLLVSAVLGLKTYDIVEFNKLSGSVSNPVIIPLSDSSGMDNGPYGVEFSRNGKFIYVKNEIGQFIYRYNICSMDSLTISNSRLTIGSVNLSGPLPNHTGALQMGPDGRIYIALVQNAFLGVINFPNDELGFCGLEDTAITLNGRECDGGLPNNPFLAPYVQYKGCYTSNYTFHLTDTTAFQHWDFGVTGLAGDTANQANPSFLYSQPGIYTVSVVYQTDWNTLDTVTTTVYAYPYPDLIAEDTVYACGQDTAIVTVYPSFDNYSWNTGDTTARIKVTSPGKYYVTASNCSCPVSDSVVVVILHPLAMLKDTSFCRGSSVQLITEPGSSTYEWSNGSSSNTTDIKQPGTYWVKVIDGTCIRSDTVNVVEIPISLSLGLDTILCEGQQITLIAQGDYDYCYWFDGFNGNTHEITQTGRYFATAGREFCSLTDSIEVKSCSEIFFPTVFTPNADQVNDFFQARYKEITQYKLVIFNRWGAKLFETEDVNEGWNGKYNGNECPEGTYFYMAIFTLHNQDGYTQTTTTGCLTLLR